MALAFKQVSTCLNFEGSHDLPGKLHHILKKSKLVLNSDAVSFEHVCTCFENDDDAIIWLDEINSEFEIL